MPSERSKRQINHLANCHADCLFTLYSAAYSRASRHSKRHIYIYAFRCPVTCTQFLVFLSVITVDCFQFATID
jgi:hypothetical protein